MSLSINPQQAEPAAHGSRRGSVFVDAHVHIHGCFSTPQLLDAAAKNFARVTAAAASASNPRYVLCLTETCGVDKFGELRREARDGTGTTEAAWRFLAGDDERCLVARHAELGDIEIVAGRQVVTAEKLEILALGTTAEWQDGKNAAEVIDAVMSAGAIAVLPWGFGKWLGRRSHVVADLIERYQDAPLYLGDNSGRPGILPTPAQFEVARELGMMILPGSDPLPFKSENGRAGSYGVRIDDVAAEGSAWNGLCEKLQRRDAGLHAYGSLESPLRFLRNQFAMQYLTRFAGPRKPA